VLLNIEGDDVDAAYHRLVTQTDRTAVVTVDAEHRASTVHGIPIESLEAQARSIGIPFLRVR